MDLNRIAMEVIINASDGRNIIDKSVDLIANGKFEKANELLDEAEKHLLKAHVAQTQIIQSQAAGENADYSLLFIHAQDTLMTANSEYRIIKQLLPVFTNQHNQIKKLLRGEN